MVDFQSRDTSRGLDDEEDEPDDEEHPPEAGDADEGKGEETDHGGAGDEGDHGHEADSHDDGHDHDDHHEDHGHDDHHDHHHHDLDTLRAGVVTVSSSRSVDDDPAGDAIVAILEAEGHEVTVRDLVPDDHDRIQGEVSQLVDREDVDVVLTTGGTGVTPDDVTIEAVRPLLDKRLPGFGELFRLLSYDEIGTKVVGTRADAGVTGGVPVFCLPGSEDAVRLGVERIVAEEAGHLAGLARR